ncbi:MAG: DUF1801 domain-containing protein [Cytophagales bacterium]|nr:DUF1801 domain-containing protein [Cytophagales bacterium]
MNPKIDALLAKAKTWQREMLKLRTIILDCGLTEEMKWGVPCYTVGKSNVVLIHGFKEYCALLFHKGALLKDAKGILIQQTKNVQSARQIRFTNPKEVDQLKSTIKAYIREAIKIEKAGLKVKLKRTTKFAIPKEFQKKLGESEKLKAAFAVLTPGRQRGYLLHFSQPKQSKTRESRIQKNIPHILEGKGLHDH